MARWSVSQPRGIGARGHCASPPTGSPASPASRSPSALRAGSSTLDLALSGWPRCLNLMVLVKPATLVQWHRQGFRLYWRWRSRPSRPSVDRRVLSFIRGLLPPDPNASLTRQGLSALASHTAITERPCRRHFASRRAAPSLPAPRGLTAPTTSCHW